MCRCLETIEQRLAKQWGAGNYELQLGDYINMKTMKIERKLNPLFYRYHKKDKDGKTVKKISKGAIYYSHCPFCGNKYND